jgi:hypothetical protein
MVTRAERASGARDAKREIVEAFIEDMAAAHAAIE